MNQGFKRKSLIDEVKLFLTTWPSWHMLSVGPLYSCPRYPYLIWTMWKSKYTATIISRIFITNPKAHPNYKLSTYWLNVHYHVPLCTSDLRKTTFIVNKSNFNYGKFYLITNNEEVKLSSKVYNLLVKKN